MLGLAAGVASEAPDRATVSCGHQPAPDHVAAAEMIATVAPANQHECRAAGDGIEDVVVSRADGIGAPAHHGLVGGPEGEKVHHVHSAVAPAASEANQSSERGVVVELVGRRRVEPDECHPVSLHVPSAVKGVAVAPARGELSSESGVALRVEFGEEKELMQGATPTAPVAA